MAKVSWKKGVNIGRVITKLVAIVIGLYVGGTIMVELGNVMINTSSPFYRGLQLIGWTVGTTQNATSSSNCGAWQVSTGGGLTISNCITSTTGSGILAVIGIVAIASIVTEFVQFNL